MALKPLFQNEDFMQRLFALTLQKLSAPEVQKKISDERIVLERVTASKITNVWRRYGGKESFCAEMRKRKESGISLADAPPPEKDPLLTEIELQKLGRLARKMPWSHAIAQTREKGEPLKEVQVRGYLQRSFGSLTGFFREVLNVLYAGRRYHVAPYLLRHLESIVILSDTLLHAPLAQW